MAQDSEEVVVAGDGRVYVAPVGTAFPDFGDAPAAPWVELGYFTNDGVTVKVGRETKDIEAFQSLEPIRVIVTKRPVDVSFKLMQTNAPQVELALGGGTFAEEGTSNVYRYTPSDPSFVDERAVLVEIEDGDDTYRVELPRCLNKAGVEFSFKREEEVMFPIELSVLKPASGSSFEIVTDAPQFEGQS